MSDNYSNNSLLEMFLFETTHLLEQLEECILNTEQKRSFTKEAIDEVFRIMHTMKGSAGMMKFDNIAKIAHSLEDLFDYLREGNLENIDYVSLSDLVFESIDFIREQVERIQSGDTSEDDPSILINKNTGFLDKIKNEANSLKKNETEKLIDNETLEKEEQVLDEDSEGKQVGYLYKATIHYLEDSEMENIRAFSVINNLDEIAKNIHHIPEDLMDSESSEIIKRDGFKFQFTSKYSYVDVHQLLMQTVFLKELELEQVDNDKEINVVDKSKDENLISPNKTQGQEGQENVQEKEEHDKGIQDNKKKHMSPRPAVQHQSIISVPVDKLDQLMDLMGEIVIAEAMVTQNPDLHGLELINFNKAARQLNKITTELQDVVMSIRMVPLSATFNKMKRLVRDMSKTLNKQIDLTILGEQTEVDKNIIEHISDPLMHLVRNALDHGIESKEERKKLGKPAIGNLTLEAKNVGGNVLIIVKDDGKGINKEALLKKAKDKGLIKGSAKDMLDQEIYNLVLLPGFSTNQDITEYSGRGVGMDVVTKNIESVGGSISIDSKENKGTTFVMKIPLTLAIIDGINLRVGKSIYTISTINIREFFKPVLSDVIIDPDGSEMVMVRGECYPILRLHEAFQVETDVKDFEDGIFVMAQQDNKVICMFVDELIGQQQIVVKALPEYISKGQKVQGLTGCTLLGDGNISLILDVAGLQSFL